MHNTNDIQILDCTLRDGGYVNEWCFGDRQAQDIVTSLSAVGVDYIELGFMTLDPYEAGRIRFNEMSQAAKLFMPSGQKLSLMAEVGYGYPSERFPQRTEHTVDLVRVTMWKRMLKEGYEYCRHLINKGYEVGIQATRTEQYTKEEFADLIKMFSELSPKAIYIVDTFGLFDERQLLNYVEVADRHIGDGIRIGYHAHNNMGQAFNNAVAFTSRHWDHPLMIDASVMGMGRGAGNLCMELYLHYLNSNYGCNYDLSPIYKVADKHILKYYDRAPWGYSMPYFLSAVNGCNPNYVGYMKSKGLTVEQIKYVFETMRQRGIGIVYNTDACDEIINTM